MRVLRDASLKKKLMIIIMATSSVALLVACAAFVIYERAQYRKEVVDDLTVKAEVIGSQSTAALKFRDPKAAREILDKLKTEKRIVAACIYGREGAVLAKYKREDVSGEFLPPRPRLTGIRFKRAAWNCSAGSRTISATWGRFT